VFFTIVVGPFYSIVIVTTEVFVRRVVWNLPVNAIKLYTEIIGGVLAFRGWRHDKCVEGSKTRSVNEQQFAVFHATYTTVKNGF